MSALPNSLPAYRRMTAADLDAVAVIEREIYPYPWTRGNFADSIAAGYQCWLAECAGSVAGYSVVILAAGEAHLLNFSVAAAWQRGGLGWAMLHYLMRLAREHGAGVMFLEVRPSNEGAIRLYEKAGFHQVGLRRGYYPAGKEREDAIVMERGLV